MNENTLKTEPSFHLTTSVSSYPLGSNNPDLLLQVISYESGGTNEAILETYWSQKFQQFFIKIITTKHQFAMSYNGSQYNLINEEPLTLTMNYPVVGGSPPILEANIPYYFYPQGPTEFGNYNYSKVLANSYLELDDCSLFHPQGQGVLPPISFDLHVKKLEDTIHKTGRVAILYHLDFLSHTQ